MAWGLESGLAKKAELQRDGYDAITRLIGAEKILAHLRTQYGDAVDSEEYFLSDEIPADKRAAIQFGYIHKQVLQESPTTPSEEYSEDGES